MISKGFTGSSSDRVGLADVYLTGGGGQSKLNSDSNNNNNRYVKIGEFKEDLNSTSTNQITNQGEIQLLLPFVCTRKTKFANEEGFFRETW